MANDHELSELLGQRLADIVLEGFVERSTPLQFVPMLTTVYLELGDKRLLAVQSIDQYSALRVEFVPVVEFRFSVDPDTEACSTRIGDLVLLNSMMENHVDAVEVYREVREGRDRGELGRLLALALTLSSGQYLFFDPSFLSGVNIGGAEQRAYWVANLSAAQRVECRVLK